MGYKRGTGYSRPSDNWTRNASNSNYGAWVNPADANANDREGSLWARKPTEGMGAIFLECSHRWQNVNKVFRDRLHWVVFQRCRKCDEKQQCVYSVDLEDRTKTMCKTYRITGEKYEC